MDAWEKLIDGSTILTGDAWEHLNAQGGDIIVGDTGNGEIQIEPERWQLIAIPVQYGYWDTDTHAPVSGGVVSTIKNYVIDQLEDVYEVSAGTMVEVVNTYIGDMDKMLNYVPGVTLDASEHNFPLAYVDNEKVEYCGIWVKSIHPTPFTLKWGVT